MTASTMAASYFDNSVYNDRLGFALCVAVAVHAAIILGVTFAPADRASGAQRLEVTLAQHRSEQAPEKADFLAQHNQEGSGTLKEAALLTTRHRANFNDTVIREVTQPQAASSPPPSANTRRQLVSTTRETNDPTDNSSPKPQPDPEQQPNARHQQLAQISEAIASLEAKLESQRQTYAKRPRIMRLTSMATRASADASYIHQWRERIEAVGNLNYPQLARQQRIFGEVRLLVSVKADGSIGEVRVLESSGRKILDEAAVRSVKLAAPFEPFPMELRQKADILEIIRTWQFRKGRLSSST